MNRPRLPSHSPILLNPAEPVLARLFPVRSPDSPPLLIVLDFDGTISPIVDVPEDKDFKPPSPRPKGGPDGLE